MNVFLFYGFFILTLCVCAPCSAQEADTTSIIPESKSAESNISNKIPDDVLTSIDDVKFENENGIDKAYDKKGHLFTGVVLVPNDRGEPVQYTYRNGLKDGLALLKFPNGKVQWEKIYKQGKQDGEEIQFYENGNPKHKQTYVNDLLDGEEIIFFDNGKPQYRKKYKKGKLSGESYTLDEQGNVLHIENYLEGQKHGLERIIENNILMEENFYENGKLSGITKKYNTKYLTDEINYKDGVQEGLHIQYKEDGSKIEIPYVNGLKDGQAIAYYPDKKLAQTESYLNNQKNGMSKKYSKAGILRVAENYQNDKLHGISRYFDEHGKLDKVLSYADGTKLSEVDVHQNEELQNIQEAYFNLKLNQYVDQKRLWYPILWLGLNLEKEDILNDLSTVMKMYGEQIDDPDVYVRESKTKFNTYDKELYFGLSPLGYAVNIDSPVALMQKLIGQGINQKGSRNATPLEEAILLNNPEAVKYLLLNHAEVANEDLLLAVKEHARTEIISALLTAGADVNYRSEQGISAVDHALEQKNEDVLNLLCEHGADFSHSLPNKGSLLLYAYDQKLSLPTMQKILNEHIDINISDKEGNSLLLKALKDSRFDLAGFLLQKGADVHQMNLQKESAFSFCLKNKAKIKLCRQIILQNSAQEGKIDAFDKPLWKIALEQNDTDLLKQIWNKTDITKPDINGEIPLSTVLLKSENSAIEDLALSYVNSINDELLWQIVNAKNLSVFQKIMHKKINDTATDKDGNTVLMYLIKNNYPIEYLKLLPESSLNINAMNSSQETALSLAIRQNNIEIIKFLMNKGADINLKIQNIPLIYTMTAKQDEISEILLKQGVDLTYSPSDGSMRLMQAVRKLNVPLVRALLSAGDNVDIRDSSGQTALFYLLKAINDYPEMSVDEMQTCWEAIIQALKENGSDINIQNGNGETLLVRLAKDHKDIYLKFRDFLIEQGIQPDIKDQYRKTADEYVAPSNERL